MSSLYLGERIGYDRRGAERRPSTGPGTLQGAVKLDQHGTGEQGKEPRFRKQEIGPVGENMRIRTTMKWAALVFHSFTILSVCSSKSAEPDPIRVDIYQDMESGTSGETLTAALMNASNHGAGSWSPTGQMWVSHSGSRPLPGPVSVGGISYQGSGGSRSWAFSDALEQNFSTFFFPTWPPRVTVACFLTVGPTCIFTNQFDTLAFEGFQVFSVLQMRGEDTGGPYLRAHSRDASGQSTFSAAQIKVIAGRTYWVNLQYDGPAGITRVAAFDPNNGYAQVGPTLEADSVADAFIRFFSCGRTDAHRDNPDCTTVSYLDNIIIDYTSGAFPLIPGLAVDRNHRP